ncbi:MAG: hypothetical protein Q8O88_04115 [bacterium]|nr:hypothetical protein [bacterium]
MKNMDFLTMDDTAELLMGDTVVMDGYVGFFQRRVADVRVRILVQNSRTLDEHHYKGSMLTFYDKLIPCRVVLTEKIKKEWL